jgi:hypothetical protein
LSNINRCIVKGTVVTLALTRPITPAKYASLRGDDVRPHIGF